MYRIFEGSKGGERKQGDIEVEHSEMPNIALSTVVS
jgi:hypothetical protein